MKKELYYLIPLLIVSIFFSSCKDNLLEEALKFAGENRIELEKVLEHYKDDSLKYTAACFLIENMPYHYGLYDEKIELFKTEMYQIASEISCPGEKAIEILEEKYGKLNAGEYKKIYDSHIITADYLIKNIEHAFEVWDSREWKNLIDFDEFCESILPYRVGKEPLEEWRETYYNRFEPLLDSLLVNKKDPVEAMTILYDEIVPRNWIFFQANPLPYMGAVNFIENRMGNCKDRTEFAMFVMRALGIPGGIDYISQHPNRATTGHSWNVVRDTLNNIVEYTLYDQRPGDTLDIQIERGKIYRNTFALQSDNLFSVTSKSEDIPSVLTNLFCTDVSHAYFPPVDITIETKNKKYRQKILYLCVFNNTNWIPIAWSKIEKGKASFNFLEDGIVYLPAFYEDNTLHPDFNPILIREDGTYCTLTPDTINKISIKADRKYPIQPWWKWVIHRPIGGRFQASNDPAFRNPVTWHTIEKELDMKWNPVDITDTRKYRYVRYYSAWGGFNNMAELEFLGEDGKKLKGEVIGTEGSFFNEPKDNKYAVFDGDPLTYYDSKDMNDSWVGLDFGSPQQVTKINYLFRNDDNSIRIGDNYELFYWNTGEWISLGTRLADKDTLEFENCPTNAIYHLRNHTRGREERIFTYENGKQIWW